MPEIQKFVANLTRRLYPQEAGQTMVEYALLFVMVLFMVFIAAGSMQSAFMIYLTILDAVF